MNAKNVFLVVSKDFYTDLLILCMTYWMALLFCTQIFPIYKYVFLKLFCLFNALSATGRSSTHIAMPKLSIKTDIKPTILLKLLLEISYNFKVKPTMVASILGFSKVNKWTKTHGGSNWS